jgi:adenylate cyclase
MTEPEDTPDHGPDVASDPAPDLAPDLERAILGEDVAFDAVEVAESTGATLEQTQRLWRALGFPDRGGERAFTQADADAVSTLLGLVADGSIDFDMAVNLTRAVGQTMARLADWQVGTLLQRVQELEAGDDATGSRATAALQMVEALNGPFEDLLLYVWRRHLAAAVGRIEALGASEEDLHTSQVTVGFADIVSFTALTNQLAHDRIGDLVEIFESRCADVVASCHGRVIKSIGDAVLFVNEDPIRAYDTAEGIIRVVGRDPRMPDVRVGLSTGLVVMRLGDVFGRPVNMASRLTAVARRNRIVVDQATADLLPADQFEARTLPERPVRGFGVVQPVAVRRH